MRPVRTALLVATASLAAVAAAVDVRIRPADKAVEEAVREALKALESPGVTFDLVASSGPLFRVGGAPAFNPDVASRTVTRDGQQIVEFNPKGPVALKEAVKREVALLLGLGATTGNVAQEVRARYGGADLNADGKVDLRDFALLSANFGKSGTGLRGDLNRDGKVDQADVQLFSRQYSLP